MGRIGTIDGTDEEKAAYRRALGIVLTLGARVREWERWKKARRRAEILRFWGFA